MENGALWILQTRTAKRTPRAALRIAIDLVREGLITPEEGLRRLEGLGIEALADTHLATGDPPVGHGIGASSGIAVGRAEIGRASCRERVL